MKGIGGYPSLELRRSGHLHPEAHKVNSARAALELILRSRGIRRVYIPYYTCDALLEPVRSLGVTPVFYHVSTDFAPVGELPSLADDEAFIYTDYFGLKSSEMRRLASRLGTHLIADCAQALFAQALPGVDAIYSPRKFVGVSDGGYLYSDSVSVSDLPLDRSLDRMKYLLVRIEDGPEAGLEAFRESECSLSGIPPMRMSAITDAILASADYEYIMRRRRDNYNLLHAMLSGLNTLSLALSADDVPLGYPFLPADNSGRILRPRLIADRIFVPTLWPGVSDIAPVDSLERHLAADLLLLPIDQRYDADDMRRIADTILEYYNLKK